MGVGHGEVTEMSVKESGGPQREVGHRERWDIERDGPRGEVDCRERWVIKRGRS